MKKNAVSNVVELPRPKLQKPRVLPKRPKNADVRPREDLSPQEVERLIEAAGKVGRYPLRDRVLILVAYRHGLRVSELIDLKWSHVDFDNARLTVNRVKNGNGSTQPITGKELRLLRQLQREGRGPFLFMTERGGPMSADAVQLVVKRAGELAGLPFPVHPHMLRHACGFKLANDGLDTRLVQDYLGHKNINHTVRYTRTAAVRFEGLWRD